MNGRAQETLPSASAGSGESGSGESGENCGRSGDRWEVRRLTYTVYGDLLFLLNLVYDFVLLWGIARFGNYRYTYWRLTLAALAGACYGVGVLLPLLRPLYHPLAELVFPVALLLLAFGRLSLLRFLRLLLYFYLLSFALSGVLSAARNLLAARGIPTDYLLLWLLPPVLLIVPIRLSVAYFRRGMRQEGCRGELILTGSDGSVSLPVFFDTGNNLREPITGLPVVVAEYQLAKQILPVELCELYEKCNYNKCDQDKPARGKDDSDAEDTTGKPSADSCPALAVFELALSECGDGELRQRLYLLPYRSVGERQGLLLGYRPDAVAVKSSAFGSCQVRAIVGLYDGALTADRSFAAIISPSVFDAADADLAPSDMTKTEPNA